KQRLLEGVLGVGRGTEHPVAVRLQLGAMRPDQALEGVCVVPLSRLEIGGIGRRCGMRVHELSQAKTRRAQQINRSDGLTRRSGSALPTTMFQPSPSPAVHLELHSGNQAPACSFYSRACGLPIERVEAGHRSYHVLEWGGPLEGGIVECGTDRALWLPYVEVASLDQA